MNAAQARPPGSRGPGSRTAAGGAPSTPAGLGPATALMLPLTFAVALVGLAFFPPIRQHPNLFPTFLGAAAVLFAWSAALYATARRTGPALALEMVLRPQHWVQACAQIAVFVWWGWYVRSVVAFAPLIVAQVIFAYGVDSLLAWSRRESYRFGFGPVPIILSINLFLWFRPEWFHWQFVMIVVGYLAKDLIRWERDGRSAHIFNPSSFPLGVFSLALLLTGTTGVTLGPEIAQTQFNPPHMYLVIFLVSLPAQLLFGVAKMTMSAVVTMFAIGYAYFSLTGTYLFYDAFISLPVFLGMHLLFTDPSTSPRTESGQIVYGMLYAVGTTACYVLLAGVDAPTFYDKLLPVPLMNLTVRGIDRVARSGWLARLDVSRFGRALTIPRRNVAYTSLWAGIFIALGAMQGVGDHHPGQYLPFWRSACEEGSKRACDYAAFMTANYCQKGSGWACNEWGIHLASRRLERGAARAFQRACSLGFPPGCENADRTGTSVEALARDGPRLEELPIVLRGSKGPVRERDPATLYAMGCEQGWPGMCDRLSGGGQP